MLATRDDDSAAATAWADRIDGLWNICQTLTKWIERDELLASQWITETAADLLWTMISVQSSVSLMLERGWPKSEYVERIQHTLKLALTTQENNV